MIDNRFRVPLSPPNSPRMSDSAKAGEYHSQHAEKVDAYSGYSSYRNLSEANPGNQDHMNIYMHDPSKSSLRSYQDSNYSPAMSGGLGPQHNPNPFDHTASCDYRQRKSSELQPMGAAPKYGASTPASPDDRLTPRSPDASVRDQQDDDDIIDSAGEDQEETAEKALMTAAELRAHKKKMKRFRLTHSQTRFLMSEFARQAHPDAGHRERLAREIPGLSARQVQVWFQNRRAKLKRHTTDDQTRMMRSRALPDDFDTTQALHSPFGAQQPHMGPPVTSMGTYSSYSEHGGPRPLTLEPMRGVPEYEQYGQPYASPAGVSPAIGAFAFTPPHSISDQISPGSSTSMSPYAMQHRAAYEGSRRGPIGMPVTEHAYVPMNYLQRVPLHEQISRTSGELTSSPLRSSISHSALGSSSVQPHTLPERSSSFSEHMPYNQNRPPLSGSVGVTEPDSYGTGFSYNPSHSYNPHEAQNHPTAAIPTTDPENFRRAQPALSYSQYPPSSYTSAPYQNYAPPYASRDVHNNFSQHMSGEPPAHLQRVQNQPHTAPGAPHPFIHTPVNRVTEASSGARHMPPY